MVTPQLLEYVRGQLAAGVPEEEVKKTLAAQGWAAQDIGTAFVPATPAPPIAPQPQFSTALAQTPKTHRLVTVAFVIIALLVAAGGVYWYVRMGPLIPPLGPSGLEATSTPLLPDATSTSDTLASSTPFAAAPVMFADPQPVTITGYQGFADEPFISRDGQYLFWNVPNGSIFYAKKVTDTSFQYIGKVKGFSAANVYNGVASMDEAGNFYFVSATGSGKGTYRLYRGIFKEGTVTKISVLDITSKQNGQDMEISADGQTLYYMIPQGATGEAAAKTTLVIAGKNAEGSFTKLANSDELLKNITVEGNAEYAPDISADGLELYYTAAIAGPGSGIYVSTRASTTEPFSAPQLILAEPDATDTAFGLREAPSISPDGKYLYYGQQVKHSGVQDFLMQIYVLSRQ